MNNVAKANQIPRLMETLLRKITGINSIIISQRRRDQMDRLLFRLESIPLAPAVGMSATIGIGSDSYPATVIEVKTPRKIVLQEDASMDRACNVYTEDQKYTYFPDPFGKTHVFTLRKDGRWRKQNAYGYYLVLGRRVKYRDPNV